MNAVDERKQVHRNVALRRSRAAVLCLLAIVSCTDSSDDSGRGGAPDVEAIAASTKAEYPLDPLNAGELEIFRAVLDDAGYSPGSTFPYVALDVPDKASVLSWRRGDALARRAFAVVRRNGETFEAVVDLTARTLVSWTPKSDVESGLQNADFGVGPAAARRDARFVSGLTARSLTIDQVVLITFGPGSTTAPDEAGRRLVRVLPYVRGADSNYLSRPVEGLVATVDVDTGAVVSVIDTGAVPVPPSPPTPDVQRQRPPLVADSDAASSSTSLRVDGHTIEWSGWSLRWSANRRTGIELNSLSFDTGTGARRVMYEAYLSDLFVPYQDPDPAWSFRTLLDSAEFGLGSTLSTLQPGIDCPATARFADVVIPDDAALAQVRPRTVCMFERATGNVAYRHEAAGATEIELVIRWISTIGNYDYVVDYVLGADGSIRFHVFAAGVVLQKGVDAHTADEARRVGVDDHGVLVGDGLVATNHDHYMNFRLDLDVDQTVNEFVRERIVPEPVSSNPGRTSIWRTEPEVVATELAGRYTPDARAPERILVRSTTGNGPVGHRPGYELDVGDAVAVSPAANSTDPGMRRGGWARETLWVTPYTAAERFASGLYVPSGADDAGLVAWTAGNRSLVDSDLVLWFNVGFHHIVRTEDLPSMPAHEAQFGLFPANAYPYNPFLDIAVAGDS